MYCGHNDKRGFNNIMKSAFVLINWDLGKEEDILTALQTNGMQEDLIF